MVEFGHFLYGCADWSRWRQVSYFILAKPRWGLVKTEGNFSDTRVQWTRVVPSMVKTESELYVRTESVSTLHTPHTFERLQSWVTKPTNTENTPLLEKPQKFFTLAWRTTTFTTKPTPHNFDRTALQQQLPKFFSLHLFNPCVLLVIYFRLAYRLHCIPTYMHNTRITCARKS